MKSTLLCCFQLRLSQKWSKSKKHHSLFTFEFWLCLLLKSDKSDIFLPDLQLTCLSFYPSLGNHTRPTYNWSRSISHKNYTSGAINLSHIYKCAPISHQHDALLMWSLSQLSTDSSTAVHERWWNDMQKHYLHLLTLFFLFFFLPNCHNADLSSSSVGHRELGDSHVLRAKNLIWSIQI